MQCSIGLRVAASAVAPRCTCNLHHQVCNSFFMVSVMIYLDDLVYLIDILFPQVIQNTSDQSRFVVEGMKGKQVNDVDGISHDSLLGSRYLVSTKAQVRFAIPV